jgi:hypothetical protein
LTLTITRVCVFKINARECVCVCGAGGVSNPNL